MNQREKNKTAGWKVKVEQGRKRETGGRVEPEHS
jgi:hypothetical protein